MQPVRDPFRVKQELGPRDTRLILLALVPILGAVVLILLTHGDPQRWQTMLLCLLAVAAVKVILIADFPRQPK